MNKEKVFAWIESLEDMADQSDRYFVERTKLYKENQEKDKEIERLNNIIDELEKWLKSEISYWEKDYETLMCSNKVIYLEEVLDKLKALKEGK